MTPNMLPDVVNFIKKVIMVDWAEVNFIIGTNPDQFIEIKFDQKSVDTELGLKAYMNTMIATHEVISQWKLKKVLKYWSHKLEGHIYFMLGPPWIRTNPAFNYSQLIRQKEEQENEAQKTQLSIGANKNSVLKNPVLFSKDIDI